ncbi:hypothetical protein [Cedecea lapagei]|uniref:hypothetical protein n=1 Tax=Cedecea lapagei TaxID=158823 RepID=UPI001BCF1B69|nr:hypothetical protein [Cedecea lapagei]
MNKHLKVILGAAIPVLIFVGIYGATQYTQRYSAPDLLCRNIEEAQFLSPTSERFTSSYETENNYVYKVSKDGIDVVLTVNKTTMSGTQTFSTKTLEGTLGHHIVHMQCRTDI